MVNPDRFSSTISVVVYRCDGALPDLIDQVLSDRPKLHLVEAEFDSSLNQPKSERDINKLNRIAPIEQDYGTARLARRLGGNCQEYFGCRQKPMNGLMSG